MRLALAFAALASVAKAQVARPMQKFFVPMPEKQTLVNTFNPINSGASAPITGYIGIAVSVTDTVIWYDHWEDGKFEDMMDLEEMTNLHASTEIWGDGDCSNGVAPGTPDCASTSSNCDCDVLVAGQSIVLTDDIPDANSQLLGDDDRWKSTNKGYYDGGDKILASYPIAVTRGMHPTLSGGQDSMLAGSVEVMETREWGTAFTAPVGTSSSYYAWGTNDGQEDSGGFELVHFYVMAGEDDTLLTFFSDGTVDTVLTIHAGQGTAKTVADRGMKLIASKPVQVDLVSGDVGSTFELRWFSLLPTDRWSNTYVSPVGDSIGETRSIFYNPNLDAMTVTGVYKDGITKPSTSVPPGGHAMSAITPSESGVEYYSTNEQPFFAMSFTDTKYSTHEIYDWGFPIVPKDMLSSQALIGWGYGCTDNDCGGTKKSSGAWHESRSVVWVTPTEAADLYVIYNTGDGPVKTSGVEKLQCVKFADNDNDMSGAVIWATKPDTTEPVNIAVAWGQDPKNSGFGDNRALDMGTVVPPFYTLRANEDVVLKEDLDGDGQISPGDICTYRIRVQNLGQRTYLAGDYKFVQPCITDNVPANLPGPRQLLISGTGLFTSEDGTTTAVTNDDLLRSDGYECPEDLQHNGGEHMLTFDVTIGQPAVVDIAEISNAFIVEDTLTGTDLPVSAQEEIHFSPVVEIQKTVFLGDVSCNDGGGELVTGYPGTDVTYCYKVTNMGNTYLMDVVVTDAGVGYPGDTTFALLAPGDTEYASAFETDIDGDIATYATVVAVPVLFNENAIGTYDGGTVSDTDNAGVEEIPFSVVTPSIVLEKTVKLGEKSGSWCTEDLVTGTNSNRVTYCYKITNNGDTSLTNIRLTDPNIGWSGKSYGVVLEPGQSRKIKREKNIEEETETASVVADPVESDGDPIPGYTGGEVTDTDPAGVEVIAPAITIEKTVYVGDDSTPGTCNNGVENVSGFKDTIITYCYTVTNTGDTPLVNVLVTDPDVYFPDETVPLLPIDGVVVIKFEKPIDGDETFPAIVVGVPADSNNDPIPNCSTVTDNDPATVVEVDPTAAPVTPDPTAAPVTPDPTANPTDAPATPEIITLPSINIEKTVHLGNIATCFDGSELQYGVNGEVVTYCFKVTNTGDVDLENVRVTDFPTEVNEAFVGYLDVGEVKFVRVLDYIDGDLNSEAVAVGTPTDGGDDVSDKDPAGVDEVPLRVCD